MSKSNTFENQLLLLLFNNTTMSLVGDATGLPGSATAGSLYVSLHTADPGEAGDQTTSEVTTGQHNTYARVAVARTSGGWTVTNNSVSPTATISFTAGTGGTGGSATFAGIGTSSSGAGKLLYSGAVSPSITLGNGQTPQITAGSTITED